MKNETRVLSERVPQFLHLIKAVVNMAMEHNSGQKETIAEQCNRSTKEKINFFEIWL